MMTFYAQYFSAPPYLRVGCIAHPEAAEPPTGGPLLSGRETPPPFFPPDPGPLSIFALPLYGAGSFFQLEAFFSRPRILGFDPFVFFFCVISWSRSRHFGRPLLFCSIAARPSPSSPSTPPFQISPQTFPHHLRITQFILMELFLSSLATLSSKKRILRPIFC